MLNSLFSLSKSQLETLTTISAKLIPSLPFRRNNLRIAVTGFSRSGKTLFLTSLINQLVAGDKLPRFRELGDKEFTAKILPPTGNYPRFPYNTNISQLRLDAPEWPPSTAGISEIRVELEIKDVNSLLPNRVLTLEFCDYPGEWLLDLPLIRKSFEDWSRWTLAQMEVGKRRDLSQKYRNLLGTSYGKANDFEGIANQLHQTYVEYLVELQRHGFTHIQPGRFLLPGDLKDDPVLIFAPLPGGESSNSPLYQSMRANYDRYIEDIVKNVALKHFGRFDRQIILVDVLNIINFGTESLLDLTKALEEVLNIYDYGGSFFARLIKKRISRVLFAATKADHIASSEHTKYLKLLDEIIRQAGRDVRVQGASTYSTNIASVKSTDNVRRIHEGRELTFIRGKKKGEDVIRDHFVGELPETFAALDRNGAVDKFPEFDPRPVPSLDSQAIPHIRLDEVLIQLIGDYL